MPDTEAARAAIRTARERHRDVMGGLSMAELKLQAAGGLLCDEDPLPYAENDPPWLEHALGGMNTALTACAALHVALLDVVGEIAKVRAEAIARAIPEEPDHA
jgi:hypothetical protein